MVSKILVSSSSSIWSYLWMTSHLLVGTVLKTVQGIIAISFLMLSMVILYPPVVIWRNIAIKTSKLILGYQKIFSPTDIFPYEESKDCETSGAPRCALVTTAVLKGDISLEEVMKIFKERVLNANGKQNHSLRYPELQQHEEHFAGFRFMKWQTNFNLQEHIEEYLGNGIDSLREIHQNLMNRKFCSSRSPWQLVLFRGVVPGHVVLGFRIHHSIADGLSALKVFVECMGGKPLIKKNAQELQRRPMENLWFLLNFPVSLGNDYVNLWRDVLRQTRRGNVLQRKNQTVCTPRVVIVGLSEIIFMKDIKAVSNTFKVTSSAVIMAGVMGGLENFIRREYGPLEEGDISMGYVLPIEGHPEGLSNHWTSTYTVVKYGDTYSKNVGERLISFNEAFLDMKSGTRRTLLKYSVLCSGACVVKLAKALLRNRVCSIGMTNIAGEEEGFDIEGRHCTEFALSSGGLDGIDLLFCVMSYKGQLRVSCVSDTNLMEENSIMFLSECVWDEFKRLQFEASKLNRHENTCGKCELPTSFC